MLGHLRNWLFSKKLSELKGAKGRLWRAVRVTWFAVRQFRTDFCFERSATLSFATIISLMPLSALLLGAAVQFGVGDDFIKYAEEKVFPSLAPAFKEELSGWLEKNISRKALEHSSVGIVGTVALVSLIFAAMGGINAAERIFNRIWKVETTRSYFQKAITFWAILTLSPFLMTASLWAQNLLVPKGGIVEQLTKGSVFLDGLYSFLVPVMVGFLGLTILYRYLPEARVRLQSAVIGAFVGALLWDLSKRSFYIYVARSSAVTSLYGPLSIVPLFLVWVYLNWAIVLWGCEVSYAHQNLRLLNDLLDHSLSGRKLPESYIAIYLLERLGRALQSGEGIPDSSTVGSELSLLTRQVDEVAHKLVDQNILVENARRQGEYVLARDPNQIDLGAIVQLFSASHVRPLDGKAELQTPTVEPATACQAASADLFEEAHAHYLAAFQGKTLHGLIAETPPIDRRSLRQDETPHGG